MYIGAGTNLGDRRANLAGALRELSRVSDVAAISSVYETEPVGDPDQPPFWNLAVRLRTMLEPHALLTELQAMEHRLGRRPTHRFGPRVIDLDVLLYADREIATSRLEIPHPRLMERAFVLLPLSELDPELRHPVTGARIADRLVSPGLERAVRLFPGSGLLHDRDDAESAR